MAYLSGCEDVANGGELPRTPFLGTGVKIGLAAAHFHSVGVARAGPWNTWVNMGEKKGRRPVSGPTLRAAPLERYFWGAGHSSGAGGVSIGTRGRCASAVSLSPAWSLAAHWPAGMNSWMNANAGEAIITISSDAVITAASDFLSLLNRASFLLPSLPD